MFIYTLTTKILAVTWYEFQCCFFFKAGDTKSVLICGRAHASVSSAC